MNCAYGVSGSIPSTVVVHQALANINSLNSEQLRVRCHISLRRTHLPKNRFRVHQSPQ